MIGNVLQFIANFIKNLHKNKLCINVFSIYSVAHEN